MIGLLFYSNVSGARRRAALAVVHLNIHGVRANGRAGGTPTSLWAGALHGSAGRRIAVGQGIVVRVAGIYVHRHSAARTGIDRRRVHGAGRYRRMIRGRRRIRNPEAHHDSSRGPEIVLAPGCSHGAPGKGRHEIVQLRDSP